MLHGTFAVQHELRVRPIRLSRGLEEHMATGWHPGRFTDEQ